MSIFKSISGFFSGLFSGSSSGSSTSGWGPDNSSFDENTLDNNLFEITLVNPTTVLPMIGGMGGIDACGNLWCEDPLDDLNNHDPFDHIHDHSFDDPFGH